MTVVRNHYLGSVTIQRALTPTSRSTVRKHRPVTAKQSCPVCGLPAADGSSATEADEYWFATEGHLALENVLGVRVATWRTDPSRNAYPRLPVREGRALAWLAVFPDAANRDEAAARLARWSRSRRLAPTARSAHPAR